MGVWRREKTLACGAAAEERQRCSGDKALEATKAAETAEPAAQHKETEQTRSEDVRRDAGQLPADKG